MRAFSQTTLLSLLGFLSFSAMSIRGTVADDFGPGGHFLRVRNDAHRLVARASPSAVGRDGESSSTTRSSTAAGSSVKSSSSAAPSPPPTSSAPAEKSTSTKQAEHTSSKHVQESSRPPAAPLSSQAQQVSSTSAVVISSSSAAPTSLPQDSASAIFIPGTPVTDSGVTLIGDSSSVYDPAPTGDPSDTSSVPSDDNSDPNANLNSGGDTPGQTGGLGSKSSTAIYASIGSIAGLTVIIFVIVTVVRRRSRQHRQDKWARKSHIWDDRADQDDGMAGFEKVEPGSVVQMSDISDSTFQRKSHADAYHLSYNSARDYFASPSAVALHPHAQDPHGMSEKNGSDYAAASEYPPNLLDTYGVRQSYAATNENAPTPAIDYPPGMAYSPQVHDQYDAQQQQRKLQNLHQFTLEPVTQDHPYAYNASPLAHAINKGAY